MMRALHHAGKIKDIISFYLMIEVVFSLLSNCSWTWRREWWTVYMLNVSRTLTENVLEFSIREVVFFVDMDTYLWSCFRHSLYNRLRDGWAWAIRSEVSRCSEVNLCFICLSEDELSMHDFVFFFSCPSSILLWRGNSTTQNNLECQQSIIQIVE